MIKDLRALGGTWTCERIGFGYYRYTGTELCPYRIEIQSYAHLAPTYDGDDDTFRSYWHLKLDSKEVLQTSVWGAVLQRIRREAGTL